MSDYNRYEKDSITFYSPYNVFCNGLWSGRRESGQGPRKLCRAQQVWAYPWARSIWKACGQCQAWQRHWQDRNLEQLGWGCSIGWQRRKSCSQKRGCSCHHRPGRRQEWQVQGVGAERFNCRNFSNTWQDGDRIGNRRFWATNRHFASWGRNR